MWHDARSARYEKRIQECQSVTGLRVVLAQIVYLNLPEQDFTLLFGQLIPRRLEILKELNERSR